MSNPTGTGPAIPQEQWDLPIAYSLDGRRMLSLREAVESSGGVLEPMQLDETQRAELVATRIERQSHFELCMVGAGRVDQQRAIREVQSRSPIGRVLIEIEQRLIRDLLDRTIPRHDNLTRRT